MQSGYTLVELLTVVAILVALTGMSIAVFASLPTRYAHEQTRKQLVAFLRRGRSAALETRSPAEVRIEGDTVRVTSWQHLLLMRFENPMVVPVFAPNADPATDEPLWFEGRCRGARGAEAVLERVWLDQGRIGDGVFFDPRAFDDPDTGHPPRGARVDLGNDALYSPRNGFRLTLWVLPERRAGLGLDARNPPPGEPVDSARMFQIAAKGAEFYLWMDEYYGLLAGVSGERGGDAGRAVEGFRMTPEGALRGGQWSEVVVEFDGQDLLIFVDGLRRDEEPGEGEGEVPEALVPTDASLELSSADPDLVFIGAIDEVRLDGLADEASFTLPGGVAIDGPDLVRFDRRGELDALTHEGPLSFSVRLTGEASGTGPLKERTLVVERSGMVR